MLHPLLTEAHRLIWNLLLDGKMAIEYVLHAHSRAITDINWHTTDPNQVVSTGIDGWLWGWDIRRTNKPVLGEFTCRLSRILV